MNRTALTAALTAIFFVGAAHGQTPASAPVAQPVPPGPAIVSAPVTAGDPAAVFNRAPAPVAVQVPTAPTADVPSGPAPAGGNQIVYTPQLPSVADLTSAAAARGLMVERIEQTASEVVVSYRDASGQPSMVTYQNRAPEGVAATAESAPVVVTPPSAVVYEQAPAVVYDDRPYFPRLRRPSVRFGMGHRLSHGSRHRGHRRH